MKNSGQHVVMEARMQLGFQRKFSQFNRLRITEESVHVSHCFLSVVDTSLVMNLIIKTLKLFLALANYKSRKVFLPLGL